MFFINISVILIQYSGYEDFIFLILIILATAAQAYAQYRKKEMMRKRGEELDGEDAVPAGEEEPYSPIFRKIREAMEDEFFEVEKPSVEAKKEPVIKAPEKVKVEEIIKTEKVIPKGGAIKVEKVVGGRKSGKRSYKKLIKDNFDLRKAVIYSEILNRKYF